MQYLKYWRAASEGPCIVIQDEVLEVFEKFAQKSFYSLEAGGILLGYVREPHLEVLEASEPTRWDRRLRCFFDRSASGHNELAQRRAAESDGLIRYIGEWHTHPEDHPTPSSIDRSGWTNLAKKRSDQRPVLGIIVGRKALHVELVSRFGECLILEAASE